MRVPHRVELKELKIRPNTDVHDYQVRLRSAAKFISKVRCLSRCRPLLTFAAACRSGSSALDLRWASSQAMNTLLQGNKVKLTCSFKGREIEFQSIGRELFEVLPPLAQPLSASSRRALLTVQHAFCCVAASASERTWYNAEVPEGSR